MKRSIRLVLLVTGILAGLLARTPAAHAVAYMAGLGSIQKTTNAGSTWNFSGSSGGELDGIQFMNDNLGVAVGVLGHVLRTTDAGATWTTQTTPTTNQLEDVSFSGDSIGYAVGAGVALRSSNGGRTWTALTSPSGACWALGVWFTSTTTGVMISDCGAIFRTTNSGASWTQETTNTFARLEDVFFPNSTTGYVVGFDHTILKTTDGGVSWNPQTSPVTNSDFKGVYFTTSSIGWVVGTNGVILFTTDGGSTWTQRGNPAGNRELRCVGFANDQEGIIGGAGVDLRTLDGGLSWVEISPPTDNYQEIAVLPSSPISGTVNVTVASAPVGRHFKVDGADWSATTTFRWLSGEVHQLEADATQTVSANEQFLFDHWSDNLGRVHTVSRTSNGTFTVTYQRQFKLAMQLGTGSGTLSPATGFKNAASSVSISATPSAGYTFGGWAGTGSGSFSGATNPATVTMNAPITETANFVAGPVTINIHSSPSGRTILVDGVSKTTPAAVTWTVGTSHTLNTTATQSGGTGTQFVWTSWSDGGARSHTVTATVATTTYTANFRTQYMLTMTPPLSPYVATPASGFQDAGSTVAINVSKDPLVFSNKYFSSWTGTGTGSYTGVLQHASVTMSGPITETANFASLPSKLVWVGTNPNGRAFQVQGTTYSDTTAFRFIIGTSFAVETDSLQNATATSRQRFHDWSDGGLASHNASAAIDAADTLIATFRTQYMLTTVADTGGTLHPASDYHDRLSNVAITASVLPNFVFQNFLGSGSGSYTGSINPQIITMNGPITETASFLGLPIATTITPNPSIGQYTVDGTTFTGAHTFTWNAGTPHTLAAVTPISTGTGSRIVLASWSDGGAATHVIAPMAAGTLTESYKTNYFLTMNAGAGGTVTPLSGWFTPGQVSIHATPNSGKVFAGWTGSGVSPFTGTTNPVNLNLLGPTTETAGFADSVLVGVGDESSLDFALEQNAPNPVRDRGTTFAFTLPREGDVRLELLDLAGRRVATLVSGTLDAGRHTRSWNGTAEESRTLGSGIYFVRLQWNGRTLTRRMVLAR